MEESCQHEDCQSFRQLIADSGYCNCPACRGSWLGPKSDGQLFAMMQIVNCELNERGYSIPDDASDTHAIVGRYLENYRQRQSRRLN